MPLGLLFKDELKGFYKSKVMIFLWVGLPVIALLFRFISAGSSGQELAFTFISSIVVSSIGGTLAAVMLAVFIINEKNRHVYDLFLIRPIKRQELIVAKFLAVYACVAVASAIAVLVGAVTDYATLGTLPLTVLSDAGQSLATSLSMIAVSCGAGVLIGVISPSVLVGAILVIYGGNQISVVPLIPEIIGLPNAALSTIALALVFAAVLLGLAAELFNRKQF
jgi:ABC-2 type transport system permease protein